MTTSTIEFSPPFPTIKISGAATPVPDPDWITITIANSGFKKRVRRSKIDAFGMMMLSIGPDSRSVPYVETNGHAIHVKETEEQLAVLLGASLAS